MDPALLPDFLELWRYMHMDMPLSPCEVIIGFGNVNEGIPRRCAQLYHAGYAPKLLFTGGLGRNTQGRWAVSEAERFARIAEELGVPEEDILLETRSSNTKENILFTRALLEERSVPHQKLLLVHQPFMEKRIYAAMGVYWPQPQLVVTSPQPQLEDYLTEAQRQGLDEKTALEVMVGDFQRMELYAQKGYQLPMPSSPAAQAAFSRLVAAGYTGQLAPG